MTAPTLTLGGPLAKACETCGASVAMWCRTTKKRGKVQVRAFALHAARVRAAPPVQTATAGDLVLVRTHGAGAGVLALLDAVFDQVGPTVVRVRVWQPGRQTFAPARLMARTSVVSLAPNSDARVPVAREELKTIEAVAAVKSDSALSHLWTLPGTKKGDDDGS